MSVDTRKQAATMLEFIVGMGYVDELVEWLTNEIEHLDDEDESLDDLLARAECNQNRSRGIDPALEKLKADMSKFSDPESRP